MFVYVHIMYITFLTLGILLSITLVLIKFQRPCVQILVYHKFSPEKQPLCQILQKILYNRSTNIAAFSSSVESLLILQQHIIFKSIYNLHLSETCIYVGFKKKCFSENAIVKNAIDKNTIVKNARDFFYTMAFLQWRFLSTF